MAFRKGQKGLFIGQQVETAGEKKYADLKIVSIMKALQDVEAALLQEVFKFNKAHREAFEDVTSDYMANARRTRELSVTNKS